MKRILCLLLAVMLLGITALAADSTTCTVQAAAVTAGAGETVDVTVSVVGNPGFTNYAILLDYDREALTLQAITPTECEALTAVNCDYKAVDAKSYGFVTAAAENEQNDDGILFTATFLVAEDFSGEAHITPIVQYMRNNAADFKVFEELAAQIVAGGVTAESAAESVLYGDANGDGTITAADATLTLRYVKNKLSESLLSSVRVDNMDVNGDGMITASDAMLILRFVKNKLVKFPADSLGGA